MGWNHPNKDRGWTPVSQNMTKNGKSRTYLAMSWTIKCTCTSFTFYYWWSIPLTIRSSISLKEFHHLGEKVTMVWGHGRHGIYFSCNGPSTRPLLKNCCSFGAAASCISFTRGEVFSLKGSIIRRSHSYLDNIFKGLYHTAEKLSHISISHGYIETLSTEGNS